MAAATTPSTASRMSGAASAASVETPTTSALQARAIACPAANPIRMPVKEPGPTATATRSIDGKSTLDLVHHALDERHDRFRVAPLHRDGLAGDGLLRVMVEHAGRDGGKGGVNRKDSHAAIMTLLPARSIKRRAVWRTLSRLDRLHLRQEVAKQIFDAIAQASR